MALLFHSLCRAFTASYKELFHSLCRLYYIIYITLSLFYVACITSYKELFHSLCHLHYVIIIKSSFTLYVALSLRHIKSSFTLYVALSLRHITSSFTLYVARSLRHIKSSFTIYIALSLRHIKSERTLYVARSLRHIHIPVTPIPFRSQELCESRGGRPGLPSLMNLRFLWVYSNTSTNLYRLHSVISKDPFTLYAYAACTPSYLKTRSHFMLLALRHI